MIGLSPFCVIIIAEVSNLSIFLAEEASLEEFMRAVVSPYPSFNPIVVAEFSWVASSRYLLFSANMCEYSLRFSKF